MRHRQALPGAAALTLAALLTGGCGSPAQASHGDPDLPQSAARSVQVRLTDVAGLGPVLADGSGHVLYMFPPDAGGRVTCTGPCAGTWPPLAITAAGHARAGSGVSQQLVSSLPDPNTGARIVTYSGYPLYRYAGDTDPGTANGQALFLNGGPWYAINADGQPLTTDPRNQG